MFALYFCFYFVAYCCILVFLLRALTDFLPGCQDEMRGRGKGAEEPSRRKKKMKSPLFGACWLVFSVACFASVRFLLLLPSDIPSTLTSPTSLPCCICIFLFSDVFFPLFFGFLLFFWTFFSLFPSEFGCLAREPHNEICHSLLSLCVCVALVCVCWPSCLA